MRGKISVCCLALLAADACVGVNAQQTPLNGGVSSARSPFAGQDPLAGRGVVMPRPSSGKCIPPGKANWKVLAEKDGDCYYFAPFATRLNGFVVNMSDVGVVERLGGRCGLDEFDQAKAVCFNPGDELPGALPTAGFPGGIRNSPPNNPPDGWGGSGAPGGTTPYGGTVANGGTASGGTAANGTTARGGTATSGGVTDPCHPYYDMSTPAGRARAVQLAAQTKQACDEFRCKHNPQLPFCIEVTTQPPVGPKGVNRESGPNPPAQGATNLPGPPSLRAVQQAMAGCLSEKAKIPYSAVFLVQQRYELMARYGAPASVQSTPFDKLPFQSQIFMMETGMALQAQAYHDSNMYPDRTYIPREAAWDRTDAKDYLVGWLEHCLQNAGLEPLQDQRTSYAQFLGVDVTDRRIFEFGSGYVEDILAPRPLLPDVNVR